MGMGRRSGRTSKVSLPTLRVVFSSLGQWTPCSAVSCQCGKVAMSSSALHLLLHPLYPLLSPLPPLAPLAPLAPPVSRTCMDMRACDCMHAIPHARCGAGRERTNHLRATDTSIQTHLAANSPGGCLFVHCGRRSHEVAIANDVVAHGFGQEGIDR